MKYAVIVQWSDEDGVYIAAIPELPGVLAHGDSYATAAEEVCRAAELALKVLAEDSLPAPKPFTRKHDLFRHERIRWSQHILNELAARASDVTLGETIQGGLLHGASRYNLHRWAADQIAEITGVSVEPTDPEAG